MLNQGGGNFAAPVSYAAGVNPTAVAAGDLNGDGMADLAVATDAADGSGALLVFLNQGNGTFNTPALTTIDSGAVAIMIHDLNQDGAADVIVSTCCGFNDLNLLSGNGDGTFQALRELPAGASPANFAIADFDGNGKPDFAVAASLGGTASTGYLTVMLNSPLLGPSVTAVNDAGFRPGAVAPASIVAGFGASVAAFGSTELKQAGFQDAGGNTLSADVFSVSAGQVNFQIPPNAVTGPGTAFFFGADGKVVLGSVNVAPVAPGIFTAGSSSLAVAHVERLHSNGTKSSATRNSAMRRESAQPRQSVSTRNRIRSIWCCTAPVCAGQANPK